MIPYSMVKRLITMTVIGAKENDDNKALIYIKGRENREWLAGTILDCDDSIIETVDADYAEDIDSIHNLDVTILDCADATIMQTIDRVKERERYLKNLMNDAIAMSRTLSEKEDGDDGV
ncbi:hypothetical protein G5I_03348 [Acromyrmex echinatior]|uniref:Uncharacterized protein n=1 Tax=Acromyrmex echinatior TaxID=103372 RepID=F4WCS2_ACREC|nr:hypothetical protein G5I_03348 [Acromyrmex echinatior]